MQVSVKIKKENDREGGIDIHERLIIASEFKQECTEEEILAFIKVQGMTKGLERRFGLKESKDTALRNRRAVLVKAMFDSRTSCEQAYKKEE